MLKDAESVKIRNSLGFIDSSNPLNVTQTPSSLTLQMDEAGLGITYVGDAAIGTITSEALWRIKRLDESGDPELIIKWADGDANFDNIWDNRASLTYS